MKTQSSPRLIANTLPSRGKELKTVRRDLGRDGINPKSNRGEKNDPFAIKDRTMDQVVECLLKELSW